MPMILPPGQGITMAVDPAQATAAGPQHPPKQPQSPAHPAPRSPFRQEMSPDLVIMPHLDDSQGNSQQPT